MLFSALTKKWMKKLKIAQITSVVIIRFLVRAQWASATSGASFSVTVASRFERIGEADSPAAQPYLCPDSCRRRSLALVGSFDGSMHPGHKTRNDRESVAQDFVCVNYAKRSRE